MTSTSDITNTFDIEAAFYEIGTPLTGYYHLYTLDGVECELQDLGCPFNGENVLMAWLDIMDMAYLGIESGEDLDSDGFIDNWFYDNYWGDYTATYGGGTTIDVQFDLEDDQQNPLILTATMTDARSAHGGFPITFTHMGSVWVFEKDEP